MSGRGTSRTAWLVTGVSAVLLTAGIGTAGFAFAADSVEASAPEAAVAPAAEPEVVLTQRVARQTVLEPLRDKSTRLSAKGTDLWKISELGSFDVPSAAMTAYKNAAASVNRAMPGCQMPWTLLAGIGRVESDHGRYGGSALGSDGLPRPAIIGIPLNGVGPVAAIHDSDNGRWDGDKVWDRAVGPMQFIPTTWQGSGRDGDGDGVENPNDIDDAALATAYYLCPSAGSVLPESAMRSEIFSYNHSDYYVDLVMAFERGYRTGSFVIPSPPPPPGAEVPGEGKPKPHRPATHHQPAHHDGSSGSGHPSGNSGSGGERRQRRVAPRWQRRYADADPHADAHADPDPDAHPDPATADAVQRHAVLVRRDLVRRWSGARLGQRVQAVGERQRGLRRRRHGRDQRGRADRAPGHAGRRPRPAGHQGGHGDRATQLLSLSESV